MKQEVTTLACAGMAAMLGCTEPALDERAQALADIEHGREVWFENTYGGETFFAFLANHPDPSRRIDIGFAEVARTPRAVRFDVWGVLNDPDCVADPAGGFDLCPDPESSGVIGIRKKVLPDGELAFGVACASCHAGFDPLHPPRDPNAPSWANIHPSIGNSYLAFGAIFAANLAADDPRRVLFESWPLGSVDTTLLFSDHIVNPGVVTHVWNRRFRPTFDVGAGAPVLRNGQGGEDDVGGNLGALRVYTNIGVCFAECSGPAVAAGLPIDVDACRAACPDLPPEQDLTDLNAFLDAIDAPAYPGWRQPQLYARGRAVFDAVCEHCHDRSGAQRRALTDDEVVALADDPANTTHACRALTTNWQAGRLWAAFSSDVYKARVAAGDRGYRTMPLAGIWATAPLLHNQSIGAPPPAWAPWWLRVEYFRAAMWELLRPARVPAIETIPVPIGPFPAGTPVQLVFSRDPETGAPLCTDVVENRGHHYGSWLPVWDKLALVHWLEHQ